MGFDVYGENPTRKIGQYFRNSIWWWRPLWNYVNEVFPDILRGDDHEEGHMNNGHLITKRKAERLAERLEAHLKSGAVRAYARQYGKKLRSLPKEKCLVCKGTGKRKDKSGTSICYACKGEGTQDNFMRNYPFATANVREFANFCKRSGGFRIH